jgi:SnoaL-like domain
MLHEDDLRRLYAAFNARALDLALEAMAPDVDWPNGWHRGRLVGRDEVRDYWVRQRSSINPIVEPIAFDEKPDGSTSVTVRQVVRDLQGGVLSDREVRHVYVFADGLVRRMDIEED